MVVSGKTFLEQEQENPVTQLSTGGKNQTVAPSDTINTSKVKAGQTTQPTGTLEKGNWTTRDRIKESITGDEAKRDILNAATTLEEGYKKVQNAVIGAGDYLLKEASSFLKTGKSYETNQEEAAKKVEQLEKQQAKNKAIAQDILKEQTGTNKKRSDMLTVVDPYKTQPQYGPYVDYSRERLNVGSIGEVSKNVTVNNDQTMAFISNGLTTVSKPVINGTDFQKTLQDAYNAITYEYANFGNLVNPEIVKQYFPAWEDASDEEINRFINECAYDVEQGKRRDISMYAENFLDLAMPDGYTSKHDAVLKLYGDDEYITYGLGEFIKGTATLEGKSKEDILNYVKAVKTINKAVEIVKENGANTKGASDFVIAKTFADDFEGLKEALEIYQNFNLTTKDLATIDAQYTATMEDLKDFAELKPLTDEEKKAFLDQYIMDADGGFFNWLSAVKVNIEGLVPEEYQKWLNVIPGKALADWYLGNAYEVDGKFYDKNGNEIPRTEARVGLYNAYINGLVGFSQSVDTFKVDLDKLAETPTDSDKYFERSQLPAIDLVNATFRGWMSVDPMGISLSAGATQFPGVGVYAEQFFEWFFGGLGDIGVKTADMIGYTDGWEESSKEKFAEAFAGLVTMPLAKIKAKLWNEFKIKVNDTVLVKSLKAYKEALKKNIDLIEERGEREKIASKKEINREVAPEEQIKGQEKIVDEMIDQETTNRKSMFIKDAMRNAISDFRKTFLEEYSKQVEAEKKANGEASGPTLIDNLFKKAVELGEQMKAERAAEVKADIDSIQKGEVTAPETTTEIKVEEQPTPEGEQVKVEETQVEKPGATVEQAKATATAEEKAAGTAKIDEKASQQTKSTIKSILSFIADVIDMGKEIKDFNQRRYKAAREQKLERKAENQRIIDAEALSDAGLTEEQIRQMQKNPYSETLLDIINSLTKEIKTSKGKITKVKQEESLTPDEIQREVLSKGIERLQKHVNKLIEMRNLLKQMYGELEKKRNIDTSKFPESKALQQVLKDYGYGIEVEIDPETNQAKASVYKLDGTDASPSEMGEMKYIEDFMNKQLKFEKKSEADLFKNRQWLKWNEDTYGKNGRSKALENSFRDAFNKFIEEQGDVKLLRTIDKGFSELSDGIDTLRELLNKDNTIKDNAKNKILKWDNEMVNQIDEIIPGFKQLVELTKVAPDIVKKGVNAKRMTKSTWQKTASVVRYVFVGGVPTLLVPSLVGGLGLAGGSAAAVILGSILFKVSENFGLKLKRKIQGSTPDLDLYNTFVDNLKITDNEKALYKQKLNKQIEQITKDVEGKTQEDFNKIVDEIAEIITERAANEIAENKLRNRGETPEEPATPEETKGPNTPKGPELTPEEKQIIKDASAIGEKEHSPAAEKAADAIEEIKQTIEDAQTDDATVKLEERGEDITPESIKNEIENPKPQTLAEELGLVTSEELGKKTETLDLREVPDDMLNKVVENPEKYGATDEEVYEIVQELDRRRQQNAMAEIKGEDTWNTSEDAANVEKIRELEQKKADAKTKKQKDKIQKQIDELQQKAIDKVGGKRNTESTFEAEEALNEQADASYNKIEEGRKGLVGKFRQNSYSAQLFSDKYNLGYKKPLSYTSSIENIMSDPNPKTRARILNEKKTKLEERIRNSKYPKAKERQIAELEKVNEAIEENNKTLNAIEEKVETEKVLKEKRSKAKTREEKKELTKQIDENNKELEDIMEELYNKPEDIIETEAKEVVELEGKEHLIDAGKYNPWKVNVATREVKHTNPKEKDIWTDSEGNEVTFYHGTPEGGFEEFSMEYRGKSHDINSYGDYGRGMYFTPFKETAEGYAKGEGKNPEIYETKLKMENPLRLDLYIKFKKALDKLQRNDVDRGYSLLSKEHSDNVDRLMKEYGITEEIYEKYEDVISSLDDNRWDMDIRNTEFDGIISEDGKEVIVPDTDQIVMQKHYSAPGSNKARISELKENIDKREKAKEESNGDMEKWNIFDDDTLEKAKKELKSREEEQNKIEEKERSKPISKEELKDKGLTEGEIEKIENLNIASDPVNEYLRNGKEQGPFDKEYVDETISALEKMDNYVGESERGGYENEIFGPDPKVGDIGENKGLWFSSDRDAYTNTPVLYKIKSIGKGTKDVRVESAKERDIVSMPGTKFKIESIKEEGGRKIIEVTEIEEPKKTEVKEEKKVLNEKNIDEVLDGKGFEGKQATLKSEQPLVKTDEKGKALEIKGNPTSKEMFERMQEIRKKAKENGGKISFRDRSELEFLKDRYRTKLEEEAKQEYNPTERDDLNREELSNIGGLNVNTYGMDIQ